MTVAAAVASLASVQQAQMSAPAELTFSVRFQHVFTSVEKLAVALLHAAKKSLVWYL